MVDTDRAQDPRVSDPPPLIAGATFGELLNVLRRRSRVILFVVVVLTTLATLFGFWREPTYTATATVVIGQPEDRVLDNGRAVPPSAVEASRTVLTQATVIQSAEVILAAMDELGVFDDPDFAPPPGSGNIFASGGAVREILQTAAGWLQTAAGWLPDEWLAATGLAATGWLPDEGLAGQTKEGEAPAAGVSPTPETEAGALPNEAPSGEQGKARERAIEAFTKRLKVSPSLDANVVSVSYTHKDPAKAAEFANAVIDAYVAHRLRQNRMSTDSASTWLTERLKTLQDEVVAAENAVERFRAENDLASSGGTALSEVQLADLNRELITIRADKGAIEAKLRLIHDLEASGRDLGSLTDVIASPLIARLREQEVLLVNKEGELATTYGPRHPRMEELRRERADLAAGIEQEVNRIALSLSNELDVKTTREQNLVRELATARSERALDDRAEVRLRQLEREAAAKRTVYESFLARQQELKAQEGLQGSNVDVLTPARVPLEPSSPAPVLFAAVGFTASTLLGCMLGLLREQLDKSLRSEHQIMRFLGLPCLSVVPQVKGHARRNGALAAYLRGKPRSAYAESMRALYTALLLTDRKAVSPTTAVLITSALPAEGKTAIATSLAVSAARAGRKVLLVDFDLHRPSVAPAFGGQLPKSGVAEVMTGDRTLDQAVIRDEAAGIDILAVQSSPPDTTALLSLERTRALLGDLRLRYDYIVLDSPPLLAVKDASVLALCTDTTVFVVRWERTKADAAASGLKVLREAGASVAGAVLTQVKFKKHARHRYGDGVQYYASCTKDYRN